MLAGSVSSTDGNDAEDVEGTDDSACWSTDEEGTLSGWAEYASGGMSISSAVLGRSSIMLGLPRPTVELAFATGVLVVVLRTVAVVRALGAVVAYVLEAMLVPAARKLGSNLAVSLLAIVAVYRGCPTPRGLG